jgi:hypothetical protein
MSQRPFYIIGHNTNTIPEVLTALQQGCNALEPDINVYDANEARLCIAHGEGSASDPSLEQFLAELRNVALAHPELAMVEFDCKPKTGTAAFGKKILDAIETILLPGTNLNVILSVGSFDDEHIFDLIKGRLTGRIGGMIDEENDVARVVKFFADGGVQNFAYGNGIAVLNSVLGPNVRPAIERACQQRAATARPDFVNVWSVNDPGLQREYLRIGVDSMITDRPAQLRGIVLNEFKSSLRIATRADNMWTTPNRRYGLAIHTGDVGSAGTDARVTFTLTGTAGAVSKTVDTELNYRMEQNDTNYVTIETDGIGALQSVSVRHDDSGNGPGWFLDRITVASAQFGVSRTAVFSRWIEDTTSHTVTVSTTQPGWRYCHKCVGMFFGGKPSVATGTGVCPADHAHHDPSASGRYAMLFGEDGPGQQGKWKWCRKCQGLFFGGNATNGFCPAGGPHDPSASGHYAVPFGEESPGLQGSWRWCRKCQGMYFGATPSVGKAGGACPAGGAHDGSASGHYVSIFTSQES